MVYVTHDQTEAMTMGDRIVVLKEGQIQQIAGPLMLYNEPRNVFVAGFIGSPAMNFMKGMVHMNKKPVFESDSFTLTLIGNITQALLSYLGKEVIWGIRPEHLLPAKAAVRDTFSVQISVVEPMGNEIFLHLDLKGKELVARVDSQPGFRVGDELVLKPSMDKSHFFDPHSGERIKTDNGGRG
jgi:multiple sugar transport system ATP-binding protein